MTGFRWLIDQFLQLPRWERLGNIVMIAIVLVSVLVLSLWPVKNLTAEEIKNLDRLELAVEQQQQQFNEREETEYRQRSYAHQQITETKDFRLADINKASYEELLRCGLSKYVARNIQKYTEKGGRIETVEDARKLYGMTPEMLARLLQHVRLDSTTQKPLAVSKRNEPLMVDLNTADSVQLTGVKGIGGKTAQRILAYRSKIGLFHSASQLDEIWGLKPENLETMKQQLVINGFKPFIHINTISEEELYKHIYFRKDKLSSVLVAYRNMHGPYRDAADLKKCKLVTDEILARILPYIIFD